MGLRCWNVALLSAVGMGWGMLGDAPAYGQDRLPTANLRVAADAPITPQVPTPPKKEDTPEATPPSPADQGNSQGDSGGDTVSAVDSAVGYIDNAIPASQIRVRFDSAWNNNRPTRAEFFYPKGGPGNPGLPRFESNIDFEEIWTYLELALAKDFSVFIDVPARFINPDNNEEHSGFGDLNAGFKYAFLYTPETVASFQLRTYVPTGQSNLGLGTNHVSLEPELLVYHEFSSKLRMESELRYWIPIGGTNFAGDVIRYGVGFSYGERPKNCWWCAPVIEFVGWTVLGGKEQVGPTVLDVQDAAGDTIVNVKAGLRVGYGDRVNAYAGYGRALTGDVWYTDIFRMEFRLMF
ncbi:MAG: hypothetical protein K2R98_08290 [Gemmataceae bacterium]|nr:hypothetical protein [Gemmataceae bacterium]